MIKIPCCDRGFESLQLQHFNAATIVPLQQARGQESLKTGVTRLHPTNFREKAWHCPITQETYCSQLRTVLPEAVPDAVADALPMTLAQTDRQDMTNHASRDRHRKLQLGELAGLGCSTVYERTVTSVQCFYWSLL